MGINAIDEFTRDISALGGLPLYVIMMFSFLFFQEFGVVWQLVIGLVLAYAIIAGVRSIYIRDRPKPVPYRTWWQKIDAGTTISMHSTRATILAIVLINFVRNIWFTTMLIFVALSVAGVRYWLKKHYLSDVVSGVVLGSVLGLLILWVI